MAPSRSRLSDRACIAQKGDSGNIKAFFVFGYGALFGVLSWDVKGRAKWKDAHTLVKAHLKQKNREEEAALDREKEA